MPGEDGLTLLQAISERSDPPRVILMTARGTIETTALANRGGAFDYLAKPFDLSELIDRVAAAARKSEAAEDAGRSRAAVAHHRLRTARWSRCTRPSRASRRSPFRC